MSKLYRKQQSLHVTVIQFPIYVLFNALSNQHGIHLKKVNVMTFNHIEELITDDPTAK